MNSSSGQQSEASSKPVRGPQYPSISLREAAQKIRIMWDIEKRNSVPFAVLASHWGYSPKSSSARGTVAALSRYGLVDAQGGDYKLSNRALAVLLGEGDAMVGALKECALSPKLYRDLWERYGTNLPSDQSLTHKLVLEGFNAASIPALIKDWRDTIEFAGLTNGDTMDGGPLEPPEPPQLERRDPVPTRTAPGAAKPPLPTMTNSVRYFSLPLPIGDAQIPMGMTPSDFDLLLQGLQLFKRMIVSEPEKPQAQQRDEASDAGVPDPP